MNDAGTGPTSSTMKATTALLCWLTIVFDGYDLVIFGAVAPALLKEPGWGMTPDAVAQIASVTLVGLFIGSLTAGNLADRFGRRTMIITTVTIFSLSMAGSAMASSALMLGGFRFLAGLGLGGLLPVMGTLVVELAPAGRKRLYHSLTFTAFPVGGIVAGGMALWLLPDFGWRAVLWVGALPLLLIIPLIRTLPESSEYKTAEVSLGEAPAARGGFASLFNSRYRGSTLMFGCIFAVCLFTSYGLLTWLPQIMIGAGFSLRSSLSFLLVMNTVALLLLPVAGFLAERRGPKMVCVGSFALAAVSIALLAVQPPVWAVYVLVGFAGFGAVGLVIQLSAYVANHYEVENRGSAMGWGLGVGRLGAVAGPLVGGWLLTSGTSLVTKFAVFAAASALGALITLAVPRPPRKEAVANAEEPTVA